MRVVFRALRHGWVNRVFLTFVLLGLAPIGAGASNVQFVGNVDYLLSSTLAWVFADGYANYGPNGESGPIRMELWAFPGPYPMPLQSGYKLAQYPLPTLGTGWQTRDINPGPVPFTPPPSGIWIVAVLLTELAPGLPGNDSYAPRDWRDFSKPLTIGPALPPALTPQIGLWWNPAESGTGYALDYKHGVLVVTVYSYTPGGTAQWYLAAGPLSGVTFTATLDKYVGGQCIACSYTGSALPAGNDGIITITFSSTTSATVLLPGGRITQIQPQAF